MGKMADESTARVIGQRLGPRVRGDDQKGRPVSVSRQNQPIVTAAVALIALALSTISSQAQGFSGLGADAGGFAQVVRGKPLVFPS